MRPFEIVRQFLPKPVRDAGYSVITASMKRIGFVSCMDAGPVDFQGLGIDPDEAMNRAAGLPCLIDVAPEHLRNVGPVTGVAYFPCQKGAGNPFVETITQYLKHRDLDYENSALKRYHDSFQPANIADALGLEDNGELHFLLHQPSLLTFPPWARPPLIDYKAHLEHRKININIENRKMGSRLDHNFGHPGMGPVGKPKGELEIRRLITIVESIIRNNYDTYIKLDPVQVIVMRARQDYRFLCYNGHHRTSALAALDYPSIPVSPVPATPRQRIIDRDDVLKWPGVEESVFTPDQALYIFDMFFEGTPPEAALRWWRDLQNQKIS